MLDENTAFLEACKKLDISVHPLSRGWILELTKQDKKSYAVGNHLELNSEISSLLAKDKVATATILKRTGIEVVEERLILKSDSLPTEVNFPVVLKPNTGSRGIDVALCQNPKELKETASLLFKKYEAIALSKFYEASREYRCFYLNGEIDLTYEKIRPEKDWRHNLSLGAQATPIEKADEIESLAKRAGQELGITFATIDILKTNQGLKILEINSGVSVRYLLDQQPNLFEKIVKLYTEALLLNFHLDRQRLMIRRKSI